MTAGNQRLGKVGRHADQRSGKDVGDHQIIRPARFEQRVVHAVGGEHRHFACAAAHGHAVGRGIVLDHGEADLIDVARRRQRSRPQVQPGEGKQAGAGADIGKVADHQPLRLHVSQHGEAAGGGRVLAGAKGLTGGNAIVAQARLGDRRMLRRVDMEGASADRFEPLLAGGQPVDIGQFLDGKLRRAASEQRGNRRLFRLARLVRKPGFQLPVVGLVLGNLDARNHDIGVPVPRILMREQGSLDHGTRGEGGDFPAHFLAGTISFSEANRASKRLAAASA